MLWCKHVAEIRRVSLAAKQFSTVTPVLELEKPMVCYCRVATEAVIRIIIIY